MVLQGLGQFETSSWSYNLNGTYLGIKEKSRTRLPALRRVGYLFLAQQFHRPISIRCVVGSHSHRPNLYTRTFPSSISALRSETTDHSFFRKPVYWKGFEHMATSPTGQQASQYGTAATSVKALCLLYQILFSTIRPGPPQ